MIRVIADENMPAVEECLGAAAEVFRVNGRHLKASEVQDADVLFVRSVTTVDSALLSGSRVRFVGTATSGFEHVDVAWLRKQGIGFSRAPGSNANSVVEYVLSAVAQDRDRLERLLNGGRLGIVGYGFVGRAVAARFRALGIECLVFDPWLELEKSDNPVSLGEALACEVVSLHPELTRQQPWPSYHLLAEPELALLGPDQLLINASRGSVIDNVALKARLQQGSAPTVILDVWEGEPEPDRELFAMALYGTAHIAGYSLDGKILATRMLCEALAGHMGLELSVDRPLAETPGDLLLPVGMSQPAAMIRSLLQQRYDIRRDDELLRSAFHRATGSPGTAFDELRRCYRERRELAGGLVTLDRPTRQQRSVIEALGCREGHA